jgi:inner membrane transporter RhtA
VLGAATSIQLGAATATTLFDELGLAGTVLLRLLFAAIALMALWRSPFRGHSALAWRLIIAFGLVVAGMNMSFYSAIDRIPLGIVTALAFIGPLAVAVWTSRQASDILWIVLAAAGVVLLSPGVGQSVEALGVAFALLAGAFWGTYIVTSARVGQAFEGGHGLALAMTVGAVVMLPVGVVSGGSALLRPELLAVGLAVALLSTALPYSLELEALRRLPAGTVGVLMSMQPAVAVVVGLVALDQGLTATELLAVGLIVIASAGALGSVRGGPAPLEA